MHSSMWDSIFGERLMVLRFVLQMIVSGRETKVGEMANCFIPSSMAEREGFCAALISKAEVLAGYKFTMRLVKNIAEKVPAAVPG